MWSTRDSPRHPQEEVSLWSMKFLKTFSTFYQLKVNNSPYCLLKIMGDV